MWKNKIKITVMVMLLLLCCVTVKTNVNANEINNNKEVEQNAPRILLKLSHVQTFSDGVEITVNYSYQDSTNEIIGIDRVYISAYPPALYSSIRITDYDILNEFNDNIRVETRKTFVNTANSVYQEYYVLIR